LAYRDRIAIAAVAWPAVAAAALLVIVTPPTMFGIGYVADRMPLFLALVTVGSIVVTQRFEVRDRPALLGIALLVAVRLIGVGLHWQSYAQDYADFNRVAATLPAGAMVEGIVVGGKRLDFDHRRCEMYGPLLIIEHGAVGPLFTSEFQQPLVTNGPLRAALASPIRPADRTIDDPDYFDAMMAKVATGKFHWVLVCDADRLMRPIPDRAQIVAQQGRFSLLSIDQ
jgi:hypothetical protein